MEKAPTIISNAIGQGEWLTTLYSLLTLLLQLPIEVFTDTPHFVKEVEGDSTKQKFTKKVTSIDPEHFEVVIDGMHKVVEKGTARIARIKGIEVCGKTGTAENFTRIEGAVKTIDRPFYFCSICSKRRPQNSHCQYLLEMVIGEHAGPLLSPA